MTNECRERLEDVGIDFNGALERFMENEELYLRFLQKFPEDQSFANLQKAMQVEDTLEAFKIAHTLKGVSGNLSLNSLYEQLVPFVELLRSQNMQRAREIWPEILNIYQVTVEAIRKNNA